MERNNLVDTIMRHGFYKELATRKPYTSYELDTRLMQKALYRMLAYEVPTQTNKTIEQAVNKIINENHRIHSRTTL